MVFSPESKTFNLDFGQHLSESQFRYAAIRSSLGRTGNESFEN